MTYEMELLTHIHDDIVRLEKTIDHATAGIGLILGMLGPDYVTVHDNMVEIKIPRKDKDNEKTEFSRLLSELMKND